ncbi:hypothetical protein [Nostoc sp. T09]|nr:hypothetical protein [Nostoc sp. T09]
MTLLRRYRNRREPPRLRLPHRVTASSGLCVSLNHSLIQQRQFLISTSVY